MVIRTLLTIITFVSALASAVAQQVTVNAPRTVVEGTTFQIVYQLDNARAEDIKVDKIDGCTELSGPGVTSSSSVSIINGNRTSSSSTMYAYTYRAIKAGTYTIPAATLVVNGKKIQSTPTQIKVLPPDSNNSSAGNNAQPSAPDRQAPQAGQNISASDIFVRIIFNKSHVYEGEAVECTLKLYTRYNSISGIQPHKLPTFDGALIEELDQTSQQNELEHYSGQNYLTVNLKKYIIFPQKSGTLTVTSGEYTVGVTTMQRVAHGFWGYTNIPVEQDVELKPTSAKLNITPLPQPQPASFTGAVGSNFNLETRLSSDHLRTNEAASISVIITGTGNIRYVKCPQPQLPVDFEQYTPSEDVRTHVAGNTVTGTVTSEYTFVPQSVGDFTVPPLEFSYFDTSKKDFVTVTANGFDLHVERGAGTTLGIVEQSDIQQRATDILHIKRLDDSKLNINDYTPTIHSASFWIAWLAVIAMAVAFLALYKRHIKLQADVVGRKTARAGRVAKKKLKRAKSFMDHNNKEQFYAEVLNAMWGYISDRLVIPVADLTRANISDELAKRGMATEDIDRIINLLDECEMARYTPDASGYSMQQIYDIASQSMDTLESLKKK